MDATAKHELLSFIDAYSRFNQIPLSKSDQAKTAFTTDLGLYCYQVMPFGLKNARATYQWLKDKIFAPFVGRSMEVHVDDMLVKSRQANDIFKDFQDYFNMLRQYRIKLNPAKCAFGMELGKFLEFMVNHRASRSTRSSRRPLWICNL